MSGNFAIKGGGVGPLMANAILNFHFDYWHTSLTSTLFRLKRHRDLVATQMRSQQGKGVIRSNLNATVYQTDRRQS